MTKEYESGWESESGSRITIKVIPREGSPFSAEMIGLADGIAELSATIECDGLSYLVHRGYTHDGNNKYESSQMAIEAVNQEMRGIFAKKYGCLTSF